jgi:hypothetical protein
VSVANPLRDSRSSMPSKHTLLITGAGASFGARTNDRRHPNPPPLGKHLARYILSWIDSWTPSQSRLTSYLENDPSTPSPELFGSSLRTTRHFFDLACSIGVEEAFERLIRINQPLGSLLPDVTTLNRVIAQALLTYKGGPFECGQDRYDELLLRLGFPEHGVTCVTLNYDLLLEEAVARVFNVGTIAEAVAYPGVRTLHGGVTRHVDVFKLHGSINWMRSPGMDSGRDIVVEGRREDTILRLKDPAYEPILGLYTGGKPAPRNQGCLESVARCTLERIRTNAFSNVLILGLHLTPAGDDPRLDEILGAIVGLGLPVLYVNPVESECAAAALRGFTPKRASFETLMHDGHLTHA